MGIRLAHIALGLLLASACKSRTAAPLVPVDAKKAVGKDQNPPSTNPDPVVPQESIPSVIPDSDNVLPPASSSAEGYSITARLGDTRVAWEGWGTSLAWWANGIGKSSYENTYADLLFTDKSVVFLGKNLPGLKLNIVRYNVGGGGRPGDDPKLVEAIVDPPANANVHNGFEKYRDMDGFWKNGASKDPASSSYDWNRDLNQRSMLMLAKARGVNQVEMFSQAPMWWMTLEYSAAGGDLLEEYGSDAMLYLANVAKQAKDNWGVEINSISPFNEPGAGWWTYPLYQQGYNMPPGGQVELLGYLKGHLSAKGLNSVGIASSDENNPDHAYRTHEFMKGEFASDIYAKVNVHGYNGLSPWRDNAAREKLRASLGTKRLWVSEYSDSDVSGMSLAQSITEDINFLKPTAWVYWQAVEPYAEWGLVNGNFHTMPEDTLERGKPLQVNTKYFVMAQFTRFIRPGQTLFGTSDINSLMGLDEKTKKLSLVTVNYKKVQRIEYDLSFLKTFDTRVRIVMTNTDGSKLFMPFTAEVVNKKLSFMAEANSIYSIEVSNASL